MEIILHGLFLIFVLNIPIFIFWNKTKDKVSKPLSVVHKIIATLDNAALISLLAVGLWKENHYFIILVPCVLLILYPISWGLNTELSDEDRAALLIEKPRGLLTTKGKSTVVHFFYFIPYYLIAAWKKPYNQ